MTLFALLCYFAALLCFVIASFALARNVNTGRRTTPNFVALGLAFWVLVSVVDTVRALN